ncbi:MAG TPA: hypothetical protein VGJ26_15260 [Pirellulales bacterium]|jgi:hypothetical protein
MATNEPQEAKSPLVHFLDSFLQERNIRWILIAGLAILFGSSVMLVTTHWHSAGPLWKYCVFLGYTSLAFVAGRYACLKFDLERTGNVLMSLVTLLLPVTIVAWRWTWFDGSSAALFELPSLALLAANLGLAAFAAREIFRHMLRDDQFTFLASYVILCASAALLPILPSALLLPAAVSLWLVFTAGALKVNRHVFWLVDELRLPRVFGFLPVALLAAQFVGLVALGIAPRVDIFWLGPVGVLTSLTILLVADELARVHEQRTGGLVWPWPLSIAAPVATGLIVCAAGLALAGASLPLAHDGRPLVIAAAIAAVAMYRVARRTDRTIFIYAALVLATVAYNFSPAFSLDAARAVVAQSAQVVQEQRLPFAFYGLTYLPLLAVMLGVGAWAKRRGDLLLARPIEHFVGIVAAILLTLGSTHPKAICGVGLALTAVFGAHERIFRTRSGEWGTIAAWLVACLGAVPLANQILSEPLTEFAFVVSLAGGTSVLFAIGALRRRGEKSEQSPFELASLLVSAALAIGFLLLVAIQIAQEPADFASVGRDFTIWLAGGLITALLLVHSFRWRHALLSVGTVLFAQAMLLLIVLQNTALADRILLPIVTLALAASWIGARLLQRRPNGVVAQVFGAALFNTLTVELSAAAALVWLPLYGVTIAGWELIPASALDYFAAVAMICWCFDQAAQFRHHFSALLGELMIVGLVCVTFLARAAGIEGFHPQQWLPVVCGVTALVGIAAVEALRRVDREALAFYGPLRRSIPAVLAQPMLLLMGMIFVGLAGWSTVVYTPASLAAVALAVAGFAWFAWRMGQIITRVTISAVLCWLLITLPAHFAPSGAVGLAQLVESDLVWLSFPVALLAACLFAIWNFVSHRVKADEDVNVIVHAQRVGLGLLATFAFAAGVNVAEPAAWQMALVLAAPLLVAAEEFYAAWRYQTQQHVWIGEALIAAAVIALVRWGIIVIGTQYGMFAVLAVGVTLWGIGRALRGRGPLDIFSAPLEESGYWLPALNMLIALASHLNSSHEVWLGARSLALFLTAGFYYWRSVEQRRPVSLLLATAMTNVTVFVVGREMSFTTPQFYMIPLGASIVLLAELLRREVPHSLRDPLRYLGAIIVLVSPVFEMLDGSWLPFLTLMIASIVTILLAIGLRVRALIYTGLGFLLADLAGMIVRGCVDHPQLLWVAGLGLGTGVLVLGALAELKREKLLARVRVLSLALEAWD